MKLQNFSEYVSGRNNNFDFLRFLFASAVILSHSYLLLGYDSQPLNRISHGQIDLGGLAVDGFFIISGMLITISWLRTPALVDYLKKRILRIYPGFIVAAFICLLFVGPLTAANPMTYFREINIFKFTWRVLTLARIWNNPETMLNLPVPDILSGVLWSIKAEFQCYLMVAVLGLTRLLRFRTFVLCLFLAVLLIPEGMLTHLDRLVHLPPEDEKQRCFSYFLAGMSFYFYRNEIIRSRLLFYCALVAIVVSAWLTGLKYVLPIFGTYALMYVAYSPDIKLHNFGKKADLSYGVYLYGWPVAQLYVFYLGTSLQPLLLFCLSLATTSVVAAISWFLVEKPCLNLKNRKLVKTPTTDTETKIIGSA